MLKVIVRKEFLDQFMSAKFAILTILCFFLFLITFFSSKTDYERRLSECQKAIQDRNEGKGLPSDILKVFRRPEVLSIFSQGYDRKFGNTLDFSSAPLRLVSYMGEESLQDFSSIDFEFLVRVILSLSAVFLAYDVISGEREAGTLRLTLSNSVERGKLLLGKFFGGLLSLFIPLLLGFIVGLLIASFSPTVVLKGAEYVRLGFVFFVSFLYLTSFFTLGMFISTLTKRSKVTLLVTLFIWVILLFIVPNASWEIAKKIKKTPSLESIAKQVDAARLSVKEKDFRTLSTTQLMIKSQRELNEIERRKKERIYQQIELSRWLSSFSPASVYSYATQVFARTNISSYQRFLQFINAKWDIYNKKLLEWDNLPVEERRKREYEYNTRFKEEFRVPKERIEESLDNALVDIFLLFLFSFFFYFSAYLSFLRYEV